MKTGFLNNAKLEHLGGKEFKLLDDLFFYSAKREKMYVAPEGIITDLASIPWWAQSFVQVLGNNIRSAILHDFNCRPEGKKMNGVNQRDADLLFKEGLAVDEVRWSKARVMYGAVRAYQSVKSLF